MRKRLFGIFLAVLVMTVCTAAAQAAEVASGTCGAEGANVTWTLTEDGVLTISGEGAMADYETPWSSYRDTVVSIVVENGVTNVAANLAGNPNGSVNGYYSALNSVIIGASVTTIGTSAFERCTALETVVIFGELTKIDDYAFRNCKSLTSIVIPDSVTYIGVCAFQGCSALTSIDLPDALTSIRDNTFRSCTSLEEILIPSSVILIYEYAFRDCTNVTEIYFEGDVPAMTSAYPFTGITATAYYPADNTTWTEDKLQNYGGTITWVMAGAEEDGEEIEITVNVPGGSSVDAMITAPEGGWKKGANTFTVSAEKPCRVFVSHDGGQTYTRLTAVAASGGRCFTAENMTADTQVEVIAAGDIDGDGEISAPDMRKLLGVTLGKVTLSGPYTMNADINEDGTVSAPDIRRLLAVSLGRTSLSW